MAIFHWASPSVRTSELTESAHVLSHVTVQFLEYFFAEPDAAFATAILPHHLDRRGAVQYLEYDMLFTPTRYLTECARDLDHRSTPR